MDQTKQIQVTAEGLEALKLELLDLTDVKRPSTVARLERARGEGDLAENSDYTNAKEELDFLDGRIDELTEVVQNAVVVSDTGRKGVVGVGTQVTVEVNGSSHVFKIVGEWEADPAAKKISHESPLGQALMDKKVGEVVEVEAPAGKITYKIVEVK